MTGPLCASMARLVNCTSSDKDVSGFCTATTLSPLAWSNGMTEFQDDPSANAPCTRTTVLAPLGGALAGLSAASEVPEYMTPNAKREEYNAVRTVFMGNSWGEFVK